MADALPDEFRTSLMLADSAQISQGKVFILGGGWTTTAPGIPGAIAGVVTVPWNETNRRHSLVFELVDDNGQPLNVPTAQGLQPLTVRIEFEVGRPPGVKHGTAFSNPIAFNYLPLPLQVGRSYEWRWTINGKGNETWRLTFEVRGAVPPPA